MTINQISIFIENKPEALAKLTGVIAENKINLKSLSIADSTDFGIVRIIVDDSEKVSKILSEKDYLVKTTGVIAVAIPDEAGSLNKILTVMAKNGRNVEYMYGFTGKKTNTACMIIRTTDITAAEKVLSDNNIRMISQDGIEEL
ncbi:MAG: ACT domain-containing protein [Treponema sp.]|nr:ACT domain-containing protein [Treponema sp.]